MRSRRWVKVKINNLFFNIGKKVQRNKKVDYVPYREKTLAVEFCPSLDPVEGVKQNWLVMWKRKDEGSKWEIVNYRLVVKKDWLVTTQVRKYVDQFVRKTLGRNYHGYIGHVSYLKLLTVANDHGTPIIFGDKLFNCEPHYDLDYCNSHQLCGALMPGNPFHLRVYSKKEKEELKRKFSTTSQGVVRLKG